jgi:hypothetical protein
VTHKFAQYVILAVSALGLSALPAAADSPCPSEALSLYLVSGFSCSVGDLDFSDFSYNTGGTNPIAASSVGVAPVTSPDGPGLNFDPAAQISGSDLTQDIEVGFTVTATDGSLISDVYIAFGNVGPITGDGLATYNEQFCNLAGTCSLDVEDPGSAKSKDILLTNTALGGPVSSLVITKDLMLSTGASGSASVSGFLNEYSEVPEPRGVSILMGFGLLAGFVFFKRRQVSQN